MGWTFYRKPENVKADLDSNLTWTSEDGTRNRVLDSAIVARVEYYAAVETIKPDGVREVWAAVFLIKFVPKAADGYTFGFKDMTESMGPNAARCPARILDLLTPLPPEQWDECQTCHGAGVTTGPRWAEHAQGKPCFMCDGIGKRERYSSARNWRARCREFIAVRKSKPALRDGITIEVENPPVFHGVTLDRVKVRKDGRKTRFYHPQIGYFRWPWIRQCNYRAAPDCA